MMDFNAEKYTKYIKTGYIDRYMGKSNRKKTILEENFRKLHKSENKELQLSINIYNYIYSTFFYI